MKKKYQGTSKAKLVRLQVLRGEVETLRKKGGESVANVFSRTLVITKTM